jgi:hypothetical protein
MDFLNKKPWHPGSYRNRKKVWTAEQEEKERLKKIEQRQEEYKAEQKERGECGVQDGKNAVKFLYQKPPGYTGDALKKTNTTVASDEANTVAKISAVSSGGGTSQGGGRGFIQHVVEGVKASSQQDSFEQHEFVVNQFKNEEEEQEAYEIAMMSESERVQLRKTVAREKRKKEKKKLERARKLLKRAGISEELL